MNDTQALESVSDVLVFGAGLAGGIAALRAAEQGARVTLVSLGQNDGASAWAQGGIVFDGEGGPEKLKEDILAAGCQRNFVPAVDFVTNEGPRAVREWLCERLEIPFDRDANGKWGLAREAAHSFPRILHVKDHTGLAISRGVTEALKKSDRITWVEGTLVDLLLSNVHDPRNSTTYGPSRVCGAYVLLHKGQTVVPLRAKSVVLATGGYSQLFQHATGPATSRGDGVAAAHRAGARTMDMEFVQFHPTALFLAGEPRRLLTEALRGEGALILNQKGESFVDHLAPRDVVARAIHEETLRSGSLHVWLDLKPVAGLNEKFPHIARLLREKGFEPQKDLIPIVPAAHYTMGGVWTDLTGATNIPGLFAAGEVACTGLHGANRLASTSLLEALVFGEQAGQSAAQNAQACGDLDFVARPWRAERMEADPALVQQDWRVLRQTMWNYLGLVRSRVRLRRAERMLIELRSEVESFYKRVALSDDLIGLRNATLTAVLVLYAALRNRESQGAHYLKKDNAQL